jgi:hypothetical protein
MRCVDLQNVKIYTSATQCMDRLGSYPYILLRCILASDGKKIAKILNYKCLHLRINTMQILTSLYEPALRVDAVDRVMVSESD